MKLGILIETKELEKAWNGLRFAIHAVNKGEEVQLFLMGEAVELQELSHPTYDVKEKLEELAGLKAPIYACGTCLVSRNMESTEICPMSTMEDFYQIVKWADQVITF